MPADGAGDRIAEPWGERTPYARGGEWPVRVDTHLTVDDSAVDRWVAQTLRQIRWANTMIKTQTPQVLASL